MMGMLFGGKPQYPPETGWERFSNSMLDGDWDHAEWGQTINRAEAMGFTVEQKDGTIYMYKSKNCTGRFMTAKGGHKLAQQFLDSVR